MTDIDAHIAQIRTALDCNPRGPWLPSEALLVAILDERDAFRYRLEQAEKERDAERSSFLAIEAESNQLRDVATRYRHRAEAAEKALADARNAALEEAARVADQYKQREPGNDSLDILSAISSYLGCGLGDENTTDEAFYKRIIWGIDNHANCGIDFGRRQAFKEAAQIVENAPLAHSNTEIAAAIKAKVTP